MVDYGDAFLFCYLELFFGGRWQGGKAGGSSI